MLILCTCLHPPVASVTQLIFHFKRNSRQNQAVATDLPSHCHPSFRPVLRQLVVSDLQWFSVKATMSSIAVCYAFTCAFHTPYTVGCSKMCKSQKILGGGWQSMQLYITKPLQKDLEFSCQNCGAEHFLKFLLCIEGKRLQNGSKNMIFKNLA